MWSAKAPTNFVARRLREGVSLGVSLAAAMRWISLCCSRIPRISMLTAPITFFFQHMCLYVSYSIERAN